MEETKEIERLDIPKVPIENVSIDGQYITIRVTQDQFDHIWNQLPAGNRYYLRGSSFQEFELGNVKYRATWFPNGTRKFNDGHQ